MLLLCGLEDVDGLSTFAESFSENCFYDPAKLVRSVALALVTVTSVRWLAGLGLKPVLL